MMSMHTDMAVCIFRCAVKQTVVDHFLSGFEEIYLRRYTKGGREGATVRAKAATSDRVARNLPPSSRDEQLYFIGRKPK